MSKKDLENMSQLLSEMYDKDPAADNLAGHIISKLFYYGDEYSHEHDVLKISNPKIVKSYGDEESHTTIISLNIPYSILKYNENRPKMFKSIVRTLRSGSTGAGSTYSDVQILQHKEIEPGIGNFVIEYRVSMDV